MTSTFHSIETVKRSLFTQTAALSTTGHNIANANTEGYTRQTVKMKPSLSIEAYGLNRSSAPGQLGTGVEYQSIERIRQEFLDSQYRSENTANGSWDIKSDTLSKLEGVFNEPSDTGISKVLNNFWNSWSNLSKDPESASARKVVKENASALTDAMNYISGQLTNLNKDLTTNVGVKASEVQNYLTSIADLNQTITRIEGLGDQANDLRDQRDLLTDKLSHIINVNVQETDQGYTISMGSQVLVEGKVVQVDLDGTGTDDKGTFLESAYTSGNLTGGEVYGMIASRENYVKDYQKQLDNLANTLANGEIQVTLPKGTILPEGVTVQGVTGRNVTQDTVVTVKGINGLHQLGYTMDGTTTGGLPFFEAKGGAEITAANISLNSSIAANENLLATSMRTENTGTKESVIKGNNSLALLMSSLKQTNFSSTQGSQKTTIDGLYNLSVGQLGVQSQEAKRQLDNSSILVEQVESQRQSVSGVSLDEEMSNMLKFQHAYNAAARFMTTFDELLDKLINSTGTVGR
ncbi:flagellar hook-associated protein 1 FlgK [Paenibacillus shirakamiensis]|uniref:Flagellar hook-associated protein 1 n=1 Tax=Paenibacillus shirakamiensis TaxID=1265935 RepID=A0ABS4JME9_9BACL|nr:flagellar hook-associated protein FlgK [Paenibacillus shirakamiensis]MBP2001779.1 flagellar hook-associated protein 1 FlgK [Paenibacillus shirakamiensis]